MSNTTRLMFTAFRAGWLAALGGSDKSRGGPTNGEIACNEAFAKFLAENDRDAATPETVAEKTQHANKVTKQFFDALAGPGQLIPQDHPRDGEVCTMCKIAYPTGYLDDFLNGQQSYRLCGICALVRTNEIQGSQLTKFADGSRAEAFRRAALRFLAATS